MDKYDFINRLTAALADLSDDERDAALQYYKELFEEAGNENEQELIKKLDSPEVIAESIIRESGMVALKEEQTKNEESNSSSNAMDDINQAPNSNAKRSEYKEVKRDSKDIAIIFIIILATSPFWIGFISAAFGVFIGIFAAIFAIIVAFFAIAVAGIVTGIALLFTSTALGLCLLGCGLVFASLIGLCCVPLINLTIKLCKLIGKGCSELWKCIFYKKELAV